MLSEEEIQKAVDDITRIKGVRLVAEAEYTRRFGICLECPHFMYGSTCDVCGCIVHVRARLADGRCPRKKWIK